MAIGKHQKIFRTSDTVRCDYRPLSEYNYIGKRKIRRNDGYDDASGHTEYSSINDYILPSEPESERSGLRRDS